MNQGKGYYSIVAMRGAEFYSLFGGGYDMLFPNDGQKGQGFHDQYFRYDGAGDGRSVLVSHGGRGAHRQYGKNAARKEKRPQGTATSLFPVKRGQSTHPSLRCGR